MSSGNERDAPSTAARLMTISRLKSTHGGHSLQPD
jgi:hypothetical protein